MRINKFIIFLTSAFVGFFFLVVMQFESCSHHDTFIEKVITDFSQNSFFILIKDTDRNEFIIENDNMFSYFTNKKGTNKSEYIKIMRNILEKNDRMPIDGKSDNKYPFYIIRTNSVIEDMKKKGKE